MRFGKLSGLLPHKMRDPRVRARRDMAKALDAVADQDEPAAPVAVADCLARPARPLDGGDAGRGT